MVNDDQQARHPAPMIEGPVTGGLCVDDTLEFELNDCSSVRATESESVSRRCFLLRERGTSSRR